MFSIFHLCGVPKAALNDLIGEEPWCMRPMEDREQGGYPEEHDWGDPDITPHTDWSNNLADRLQGKTERLMALGPDTKLDVCDPIVLEGDVWFSIIAGWVGQRSAGTLHQFYQQV